MNRENRVVFHLYSELVEMCFSRFETTAAITHIINTSTIVQFPLPIPFHFIVFQTNTPYTTISAPHGAQIALLELEQRAVPIGRRRQRELPIGAPTPHSLPSLAPRKIANLRVVNVPHVESRTQLVAPVQKHFLRRRHRQHMRIPSYNKPR